MLANIQNKKLAIFFGGLAGVVVVLVVGINFLLKLVPSEEKSPPVNLPPIEAEVRIEGPGGQGAPLYQIIEPGVKDPRPIIYGPGGFLPTEITIHASDPLGCLITVINGSGLPLRVGVNPHNPDGDPGANYGQTPPGQSAILDVRYPGLAEISLHSHSNKEHEFKVIYGQGCK